jgi:putative transposase
MLRTYKYKLYESKRLKNLHNSVNIAGIIYNHCIALHKRYYRLYKKHLNKYQLQKHITKLKKLVKHKFWSKLGSQAIQDITDRIDKAYKKFFDYVKNKTKQRVSPPNFKKVKKYKSFTLKGKVGYKLEDNVVSLNGYKYRFWLSRPIDGTIKTLVIKRDNIGDFYICVSLELEESKSNIATGNSVGIDFGLDKFLSLSDKQEIEAPLYHLKSLNKLKLLNRSLAEKKKGSKHRKQAKFKLSKLHMNIANQRRDYFHKLSNKLAAKYDNIIIEDLNLKAMQKLWGRKVSDLAFAEFVQILECKTKVIRIDRFYPSSKTCSSCFEVNKEINKDLKSLKTRKFKCNSCGLKIDRDYNASLNILRVGVSTLSTDTVRLAQAS